jgi:hypothetical protein
MRGMNLIKTNSLNNTVMAENILLTIDVLKEWCACPKVKFLPYEKGC